MHSHIWNFVTLLKGTNSIFWSYEAPSSLCGLILKKKKGKKSTPAKRGEGKGFCVGGRNLDLVYGLWL